MAPRRWNGRCNMPLRDLQRHAIQQRHFGTIVHFQVRQHQILAEGRPHPATGDGRDLFVLAEINESHGIPNRRDILGELDEYAIRAGSRPADKRKLHSTS